MLILTRKLGEGIAIGDDIRVKVVEIRGNHVRIGIDAPRTLAVHREEVLVKIVLENKLAAELKPDRLHKALPEKMMKQAVEKQKKGSLL